MTTSPTLDDEVAFLTGVKSDGTLTPTSYWGWNGDTPATYNSSWTRASKWGGTTAGTAGGTVYYYFNPTSNWSATEQAQLSSGLALWAAVANINFVQTTNSSQAGITFSRGTDGGAYTYTIYSANAASACQNGSSQLGTITSAPISIDTNAGGFGPINGNFTNYGGYPIMTFLHEEGHALGLGHAGAYNDTVAGSQQFSAYDNRQFSIMSYFNPGQSAAYSSQSPVTGTNWNGNYATTLMPLDILAVQRLYGVAVNTPLSGGQIFGFHCNVAGPIEQYFDFTKNVHPVITIWDKGANNTLDLSGFTCASTINLNAGTWSSTAGMKNNIAIAAGTLVDTLVCSAGGTTVTCNSDNDTVIGGAGNDVITLGGGNDTVNGGGGTDTVKFGGTYASYTVTVNTDGSLTVTGSGIGTDTLTGVENLQFSDQSVLSSALNQPVTTPPPSTTSTITALGQRDFNGDGKGDVLLTNSGCSSVQLWLMNGTAVQSAATLGSPGTNWSTILSGDFNGDGKTDVLWQNTNTSAIQIWTMNGTSKASSATLTSVPGAGWSAVATGDFNGDKNADIVLENGSQVEFWLMSGPSLLSSSAITTVAPAGFKVVAAGDFNGDGSTDILWQNPSTGQLDMWLMNGTSLASDNVLASNPGTGWRVVDSGDFNGDGKSDILLQNSSTGQTAIWLMNGTSELAGSGNVSGNLGTGWKAVAAADYNGDGKSDILFRSPSSGAYTAWLMSGTTVLSGSGTLSANPGTSWFGVGATSGVIAPVASSTSSGTTSTPASNTSAVTLPLPQRDFNDDGKGDVLLANSGQTSAQVWTMNGTTMQSAASMTGPGANWTNILSGDFNGDGKTDILWQNTTTSALNVWTMNGTTKVSSAQMAAVPGAGWGAVATGDFNGDGTSDIVLQNGSQVEIWLMNGAAQLTGSGVVASAAPSGFHAVGTGDFNGDGKADILWQNSSTGQLEIWEMNGTTVLSDTTLTNNPGSGWRAVTTGDFNHDGKSDVLLQNNNTGQTAIWFMDGTAELSGSGNVSSNLGSSWRAVAAADYNGDGTTDILFRNPSNGQFAAFMMSGTTSVMSSGTLSINPGTAWHAVA